MRDNSASAEVEVTNEKGLHTRTSTAFVKSAMEYVSEIRVASGQLTADGKSVMALLALGAKKGVRLKITCEGPDQHEALAALTYMVSNGFPGVNDEGTSHH